jgi:exonuclease SbcC
LGILRLDLDLQPSLTTGLKDCAYFTPNWGDFHCNYQPLRFFTGQFVIISPIQAFAGHNLFTFYHAMIPLHLSIAGFLSYREPVELDFTRFDLACISGPNGAGKSSLLDAITWALFGQARKRDDSLINAQSSAAKVSLAFAYEGNVYRVLRAKPRDKTSLLEFHILQRDATFNADDWSDLSGAWRPLTERSLRETEARIQQTLRMDYETFTNASFFLQGKADQFTQQRPGDRKRILSSILGLEIWESYKERAAQRRKDVEAEIRSLDGRLQEINAELAEEKNRKQRLAELEADLERLSQQRQSQDLVVQNARQIYATLLEQERLVEALQRQVEAAEKRLLDTQELLLVRQQERSGYAEILARAEEIQARYEAWQQARRALEQFEKIAAQFREQEKQREAPRLEIQTARARLEQELQGLITRQAEIEASAGEITDLKQRLQGVQSEAKRAEERRAFRLELEARLQRAIQQQAEARAENPRLKKEMDELKARLDQLEATEGATCPLCGQPLSSEERKALIEQISAQGRQMGDRFRNNTTLLKEFDELVKDLTQQIAELGEVENELRQHDQAAAQLNSRLEALETACRDWEMTHAPRLEQIRAALQSESYALEARTRLAEIDRALSAIGYDAAAHDAARQAEEAGRASEDEMRFLEKARAALAPLEREIAGLQQQMETLENELFRQRQEYQNAAANLQAARTQAPDLDKAESLLIALQEQESYLQREVGAARQRVDVLDEQKRRKKELEAQREQLAVQARQYKQLERAFGKDGVPALLIEQALPEIENKANEILARLSSGSMSVRFVTQAAYKDKSRDDLRETLDIQISDGAGTRDYEMFSGGEAFRVNFAIRLALSEVLAQRAGARLQTLVIDEGFGSQDAQGRQRLIEAINLVRSDFAKIIVITHLDELKDAFPARIEVEKTALGSLARVI